MDTLKKRMTMSEGSTLQVRAGKWGQDHSHWGIFATLDSGCRLDELPFMPKMLEDCGKTLRVGKRMSENGYRCSGRRAHNERAACS